MRSPVSGYIPLQPVGEPCPSRVFLLSPANTSALRGQLLLNKDSQFELAHRIRRQGAPLGEIFSFISSLYFRGKLAYGKAFGNSPPGMPPMLVLTTSRGLLSPETTITLNELTEMSGVPIDLGDSRYREPLVRDARTLADQLAPGSKIVLLGSIATGKYVDPLLEVFGPNLLFPEKFVGRGDMSRGGLMLRWADVTMRCVTARIGLRAGGFSDPPRSQAPQTLSSQSASVNNEGGAWMDHGVVLSAFTRRFRLCIKLCDKKSCNQCPRAGP